LIVFLLLIVTFNLLSYERFFSYFKRLIRGVSQQQQEEEPKSYTHQADSSDIQRLREIVAYKLPQLQLLLDQIGGETTLQRLNKS